MLSLSYRGYVAIQMVNAGWVKGTMALLTLEDGRWMLLYW
jgi:hypothetical protein